jgi:predicted alpha/beta superfamily hydrolase
MPELEVLLRNDLTNAEKAGMLGRSYYAVVSAGSLLNRTDELRRVVG